MKMGYQGVALLLAAVLGIGLAAYEYYTQLYTPETQGNYGGGTHTYKYDPPEETQIDNSRRRRRRRRNSMGDQCTICCEDLTKNVRQLDCQHSFHISCIENWFKEQKTCPICRKAFC